MNIEFRNHPAQARHPVTNAPLFFDDGKTPVPLLEDQHGVYLDGFHVGYTHADGSRFSTVEHLSPAIVEQVVIAMQAKYGCKPSRINQVPQPDEPELLEPGESIIVSA